MSTGQHNLRLMQQCTCWCCRNPGYGLSCARSTGESAETSKGLSKTLEGMVERLEKLEGRLPPLGEQDVVTRQLHVALLGLRCDILHTRLTPVRRSSKTTAALRKHLMDKSDKNPVKMSVKRSRDTAMYEVTEMSPQGSSTPRSRSPIRAKISLKKNSAKRVERSLGRSESPEYVDLV